MAEARCVRCGRPLADGAYVCHGCGITEPGGWLAEIADTAGAARDIARGLSGARGSGGAGRPESRLPLNLAVAARLDAVANELGGWVRHVAEERGLYPPHLPRGADPIPASCRFLAGHLEWFRHRAEVDGFLADLEACVRIIRSATRGPGGQHYLGACGSTTRYAAPEADCPVSCACHNGPHYACDEPGGCGSAGCGRPVLTGQEPCQGSLYARVRDDGTVAPVGRCRTCRGEVHTADRRAWLDTEVRRHAYTRRDIADAYGIKPNTITVWWLRRRLRGYWVTGTGLHVEWAEPALDPALTGEARAAREREIDAERKARGPKVFYLGDVLDLAAADAARREERRAERERRAAKQDAA